MKRIFFLIVIAIFTHAEFAQNLSTYSPTTPYFSIGNQLGYNSGFTIQLNGTASNFASDFPFSARLGFEYSFVDPGNPAGARKIFINDATNGTPEESGKILQLRLDLIKKIRIFSLNNSFVFVGPRFSFFTGTFSFIGGNEVFDINSNQFGLGGGIENYFKLSDHFDLVISTGVDYFFLNDIYGHDTSYGPNGENVNPRENFTFSDADNTIDQPKIQIRFLVGFVFYI